MGLPVEVLRALMQAGASNEAILAASEAAEAREQADRAAAAARDEERRARARESNRRRQAAWYDRNVRNNEDNGVSACNNAPNDVTTREDVRGGDSKKSPRPPINPTDLTPTLPSEAPAPLPAKARRFDWPEDFEARFWATYPRRVDRKKSMVVLGRIRRADRVAFADILAGCQRLSASDAEIQFLPHPTTWLNGERWLDEVLPQRPPPGRPPPGQRISGITAHAIDRIDARRTEARHDPSLDLDRGPRPERIRDLAAPADRGAREARRDAGRDGGDEPRSVFDFPQRRAHG